LKPAFLLFGVGLLVLDMNPRLILAVTCGLFVWFFLVEIVDNAVTGDHWILDPFAFHQMAVAPLHQMHG
jgi:hypothetical protein